MLVGLVPVLALGQVGSPLPSTAFTRDWLRSTNAEEATLRLGLLSTNQTTVTNWITAVGDFVVYTSSSGLTNDTPEATLDSQNPTSFGTDQTAKLQALLNRATNGGSLRLVVNGRYTTGGLLVYSNTWIDIQPGCGLVLLTSNNLPLIRNANQTSNNPVDVNITISGGTLNFNGGKQGPKLQAAHDGWGGGYMSGLEFIGSKNMHIRDTRLLIPCAFTVYLMNTFNSAIERVTINTGTALNRDGIHWNGPGGNWVVRDCYLENVGDDGLALNANDAWGGTDVTNRPSLYGIGGPLTNFTIHNINYTNCFGAMRMLSSGALIDGIQVDGIHGNTYQRIGTIDNFAEQTNAMIPQGAAIIGSVSIRNFDCEVTAGGETKDYMLSVNNAYFTNFVLDGWSRSTFVTNTGKNNANWRVLGYVGFGGGRIVGSLDFLNWKTLVPLARPYSGGSAKYGVGYGQIEVGQPVNAMRVMNCSFNTVTNEEWDGPPIYLLTANGKTCQITNLLASGNHSSNWTNLFKIETGAVLATNKSFGP